MSAFLFLSMRNLLIKRQVSHITSRDGMLFCNYLGRGKLMSKLVKARKPALSHTQANLVLLRSDHV